MFKSLFGSSPAPSSEPGLLERLKAGIQKTRAGLMEKLEDAVSGRKEIDAGVLEELEYALITADIGAKTTAEILELIRQRVERHQDGGGGQRSWEDDVHRQADAAAAIGRAHGVALRRRYVPRRGH